jgi:hypothetical protein
MLQKAYNASGQKAYQRTDTEDRSLIYRNWLRTVPTDGYFLDIDFVKFKMVNGTPTPVAITDLTRCDSDDVGQKYLDAIINRFFVRDRQGYFLKSIGKALNIPVYLVLFPKSMKWVQVFSFQKEQWKKFTPEEWAAYLKAL